MNQRTRRTHGWVLVCGILLSVGCGGGGSSESSTVVDGSSQEAPAPVLKNLGIAFGDWDPATNKAGAFAFNRAYDRVFLEFGLDSRSFEYRTLPNSDVFAVCDGVVTEIVPVDAGIRIRPSTDSPWVVAQNHVKNPTVSVGSIVKAGDVIGKTADLTRTLGRTMIAVANDQTKLVYAPFKFFDPALAAEHQQMVWRLMLDWEAFKGNQGIYDEAAMIYAGCYAESYEIPQE